MNAAGILQIVAMFVLLTGLAIPLGIYMAHVYQGERTFAAPVIKPVDRFIYRITRVDEAGEMAWPSYALAMLAFSLMGFLILSEDDGIGEAVNKNKPAGSSQNRRAYS